MILVKFFDEPDISVDALKQLLDVKYLDDAFSILSDSSCSTLCMVSLRTKSKRLLSDAIALIQDEIDVFEIYIPEAPKPSTNAEMYIFNNDQFAIPPIKQVVSVLNGLSDSLDLTCYRLDETNLYLMCEALVGPPASSIVSLNLSKCPFAKYACITLATFIEQSILKVLNLSNCLIGPEGIEILAEAIEGATDLIELNMSNCNLRDAGCIALSLALAYNDTIRILDLSRNKLHTGAAIELGKMLKINTSIEELNLSWNDLYPAFEVCKLLLGMRKNKSLLEINLSWNGLCDLEICESLASVIKRHKKLLRINLEYNCFREEGLTAIIDATKKCRALEEIYLGGNTWTITTMKLFITPPFKNIKILSFGEFFYLPTDVYNMVEQVKYNNRQLNILFKGKVLPNPPEEVNFQQIVLDRCKFLAMKPKKKTLKRDMGHFMLELQDNEKELLTISEFKELLAQFKAKLDDDLNEHLQTSFTYKMKIGKRKVKRVDIKQMAEMYLSKHPTDPPPPPKPKKAKKEKKPPPPKKK